MNRYSMPANILPFINTMRTSGKLSAGKELTNLSTIKSPKKKSPISSGFGEVCQAVK